MTIKELDDILKSVLEMEPLTTFKEPMSEANHQMKFGLARMYAEPGFRAYLENQLNAAIKNAALSSHDEKLGAGFKFRILTIKELISKSKEAFQESEKLHINLALENAVDNKRKKGSLLEHKGR